MLPDKNSPILDTESDLDVRIIGCPRPSESNPAVCQPSATPDFSYAGNTFGPPHVLHRRNMTGSPTADDNRTIRNRLKPALLVVFLCVLACPQSWSQAAGDLRPTAAKPNKSAPHSPLLTRDE